jgi:hypothetical protein
MDKANIAFYSKFTYTPYHIVVLVKGPIYKYTYYDRKIQHEYVPLHLKIYNLDTHKPILS